MRLTNKKARLGTAAALAIATAATVTVVAPADASLTTRCVGTGGAVTVPGDLVVPRGKSCVLTGTTVNGDVRVAKGANLIVTDGTFNATVRVGPNGYVDTTSTSMAGDVTLRDGYGAYLDSSTLSGRVASRPGEGSTDGFIDVDGSTVAGDVVSRAASVRVEGGAQVSGSIRTNGAGYTDVYSSFVDGPIRVRNNALGGVICGSAVQGAVTYRDSAVGVQLGADGPLADCAGPGSYFGSTLRVSGISGGVYVDNAIVGGDLVLRDNTPTAQIGDRVVVGGQIRGDYTGLGTATVRRLTQLAAHARSQVQHRIDRRTAAATRQARAAGPANLS